MPAQERPAPTAKSSTSLWSWDIFVDLFGKSVFDGKKYNVLSRTMHSVTLVKLEAHHLEVNLGRSRKKTAYKDIAGKPMCKLLRRLWSKLATAFAKLPRLEVVVHGEKTPEQQQPVIA